MAVAIARREIHAGIDVILAQDLFHQAVFLDEIAPVVGAEKPEADDAVAHRDLIGGLGLPVRLHELFDRQSLLREPLRQPAVREGEVRTLPLQVPGHLGEKRPGQRRVRPRHVGHHQDQIGRILLDHQHHALGPVGGQVSIAPAAGHACRHAPKVFDQRQAQHDRHGP